MVCQLLPCQPQSAPVLQPLPCHKSFLPWLPISAPLPVWMNVSSLTPWFLDFQTVGFSGNSVFFVFKFVVVLLVAHQPQQASGLQGTGSASSDRPGCWGAEQWHGPLTHHDILPTQPLAAPTQKCCPCLRCLALAQEPISLHP